MSRGFAILLTAGLPDGRAQHGEGIPGLRLVTLDEPADHGHPAVTGPVGEGAAQRGGLHLLRRALHVGTGHRAVRGPAARVLRRPDRALPGTPCALLPVRLAATAADSGAGLRGVRALACSSLLCHHHLVDQRNVDAAAEYLVGEFHVLVRGTGRGDDADDGAHFSASLAGASLGRAGGAQNSSAGRRVLAAGTPQRPWRCVVPEARRPALCGVRPGACGTTGEQPEADSGSLTWPPSGRAS